MSVGPKHEWLSVELQKLISTLPAHAALSTERELAVQYGVSRATVRTALQNLEAAGVVYRVQGAGTFVSGAQVSKTLTLTSFTEDMRTRGRTPTSEVIAADEVPAGTAVACDLRIGPAEAVVRLVRLRLADDEPMCLETTYLIAKSVPGLLEENLSTSLYERFEELGIRPARAEQVVKAVTLEDVEAGILAVPPGSPALHIERVGLDQRGDPFERTTSIYRADRYDITFAVQRHQA